MMTPSVPNIQSSSSAAAKSDGTLSQYTGAKTINNAPPASNNLMLFAIAAFGLFLYFKRG